MGSVSQPILHSFAILFFLPQSISFGLFSRWYVCNVHVHIQYSFNATNATNCVNRNDLLPLNRHFN